MHGKKIEELWVVLNKQKKKNLYKKKVLTL
jgi:hypothetical protein